MTDLFPVYFDMGALALRQAEHGCRKSDICNMDFTRGYDPTTAEKHINRLCCTCYRHWAGPLDSVREYSRAEWDVYVEQSWRDNP